jgi:hypothetical protein
MTLEWDPEWDEDPPPCAREGCRHSLFDHNDTEDDESCNVLGCECTEYEAEDITEEFDEQDDADFRGKEEHLP